MTATNLNDGWAALSEALADHAAAAAACVVAVHGRDGSARSGVLWADGLVVTAEESLDRDDSLAVVLPNGTRVAAVLAGRDPGTDVALLRAETGPVAALPLAPADAVRLGHLVLAVGRGEHGPLLAWGPVAELGGPWRSMRGGRLDRRIGLGLRLTMAAEGGVVLDHAGRLVGMAVPGPRRRVLAIPAATIARSVEVLRVRGRVARGYLGVAMQPVGMGADRGLIVVGVDRAGPAAQAGVLLGDVLATWDGAPLRSVRELLGRLDPETVGTEVVLDIVRAGQPQRITVRIGERAAA